MTTENSTPDTSAPDTSTPEGRADVMTQMAQANPSAISAKFVKSDGTVDVAALHKSYLELERAQSGQPAPVEQTQEAIIEPVAPVAEAKTFADALNEAPAPDNAVWNKVEAELNASNAISAETVAELTASGVPASIIQSTTEAFKARQEQAMVKAAEIVGGKEQLDKTLAWAKSNLSVEERQTLIQGMNGPGQETLLLGLHARAQAANPEPGQHLQPTGPGFAPSSNAAIRPYETGEQMQADMQNPKYKTDPDFRRTVMKRMGLAQGIDPSHYDNALV